MTSAIDGSRRDKALRYLPIIERLLDERGYYSLSLSEMAYVLDIERTYCSSIFPQIAGRSFGKWMREIRINAAMRLLRETSLSITRISQLAGFDEVTTFDKNFKKELGMCPRKYRKSNGVHDAVARVDRAYQSAGTERT